MSEENLPQGKVDFVCFDSGSTGPEWRLVEIEAPERRLFTSAGDPSAPLSHAMRQVRDWQTWIEENRASAQALMPHIEHPMGYVFMGRLSELTADTRKRLKRLNYENRMWCEIHTLDRLAQAAREAPVARDGGHWHLPMKALSHRDLARGLPEEARQWMEAFFRREPVDYPGEFLEDREHGGSSLEFGDNE